MAEDAAPDGYGRGQLRLGLRTQRIHGLGDVESAIVEFTSENAADIEAAKTAWADVEKSAAELGFVGQSGSLDR